MTTTYAPLPPSRVERLLPRLVDCPRCRMPVWEPRLIAEGCPTCKVLDSHGDAPDRWAR